MNRPFLLAVFLLVAAAVTALSVKTMQPTELPRPLAELPDTIGSFRKVQDVTFEKNVEAGAGMDEYIMRYYEDAEGYALNLYVGYYRWQSEGHIIHSPKHCLPGSGWVPVEEKRAAIPAGGGTMNESHLQRGEEKQLAFFWYQGRGRKIASEYMERVYMILDSILLRRSDGALVRVLGPAAADAETTRAKMQDFLQGLVPVIDTFLPGRDLPPARSAREAMTRTRKP